MNSLDHKLGAQDNMLMSFLVEYCLEGPDLSSLAINFQHAYLRYCALKDGLPMLGERFTKAVIACGFSFSQPAGNKILGVCLKPGALDEIEKAITDKANAEYDAEIEEEAEEE